MNKPKLLTKLKNKTSSDKEPTQSTPERVTNNSVSDHRDQVLSRGRKFKYPFYRSKHKVVIISLILVFGALLLLGAITGLQLYKWQGTSEFTTSVTKIFPFPVANVNGNRTSYESYLFELGYSLHWEEKFGTTDLKSPDGKRKINYLKRLALDKAMTNTIAQSFAKENNIEVEEKEVDAVIGRIKANGGDLSQITKEQYNLSEAEIRRLVKNNILQKNVSKILDKNAPKRAEAVLKQVKNGKSFSDVAKESSEDLETKQLAGDIGVVEKDRANLPEEVSNAIFKLKVGEVSEVIEAGSDYYITTVREKVDEKRAKVSIIRIKSKDMSQYLEEYKKQGKVNEYIKIEEVTSKGQVQQ